MSSLKLLFTAPSPIPCRGSTRAARAICSTRAPPTASLNAQRAAIALSVPALPIVAYSEFVLATSGCGLPAGPGGSLGAAEGISYLVVAGVVAASVYSKVTTGKGLPEGPAKLLGAAEGVAYLLVVVGLGVAAYTANVYGGLPNAVPTVGSRCNPLEQ